MSLKGSLLKTSEDIFIESEKRRKHAYNDIRTDFWIKKDAFTHRFDNFRNMVDSGNLPQKFDDEKSRRLLTNEINDAERIALYFGVPWCVQTCSYCDLAYSRNPDVDEKKEYVDTILQELSNYKTLGLNDKKVASIYFGGGTPSIIETDLLVTYLDNALRDFDLQKNSVITLEASPATISRSKLRAIKGIVNRISLGVQSTDTELRQREGRILPREKLLERVDLALDEFDLVNTDVLYGMPGQNIESIFTTLKDLIDLGVPSITYYRYELFQNTKSYAQAMKEPWPAVKEDYVRGMYYFGKTLLESAGYTESPLGWFIKIENNVKPVASWSQMVSGWGNVVPYFGFGVGAFSTSKNYWMQNCEDVKLWSQRVKEGKFSINKVSHLNMTEKFMVKFMRHIRVFNKIDINFMMEQSGVSIENVKILLKDLCSQGIIEIEDNYIKLTDAGCSLIHWVIDEFEKTINNKFSKFEVNSIEVKNLG